MGAEELRRIHRAYHGDKRFDHLRVNGIRLVPGRGSFNASYFAVGEAPGATENTHGRPFVGASGRVLVQLMESAGLSAEEDGNTWLTNMVKYRPPGNRTPTGPEIRASLPYLRMEWSAVGRPGVFIAIGSVAFQALGGGAAIGSLLQRAGNPIQLRTGQIMWPMVHPAYALRNYSYRSTMEKHWEDFGRWRRGNGKL